MPCPYRNICSIKAMNLVLNIGGKAEIVARVAVFLDWGQSRPK